MNLHERFASQKKKDKKKESSVYFKDQKYFLQIKVYFTNQILLQWKQIDFLIIFIFLAQFCVFINKYMENNYFFFQIYFL